MLLHPNGGEGGRGHTALVCVAVLVILLLSATDATAARHRARPAPEAPVVTQTPIAPDVQDTPTNLQAVFANEVNARERYVAYAAQADREGYRAAANLLRACAAAEEVHAHRHVAAIAAMGGKARAVLDRVTVGTTPENLQSAIASERYELTTLYPALIARARADHDAEAVRSMTFALSAEREHARLLEAALAALGTRPVAGTLYVCPYCGRTVAERPHGKCPNCFTPARRMLKFG